MFKIFLMMLFLIGCSSAEKKSESTGEIELLSISSEFGVVMVNQEFIVRREVRNRSGSNFGKIEETIYVDGYVHSEFTCNMDLNTNCSGDYRMKIGAPGKHIVKSTIDPKNLIKENDKSNNSKEIEIIVHDYASLIKDCFFIIDSFANYSEQFKNRRIALGQYKAAIESLYKYVTHLSYLKLDYSTAPVLDASEKSDIEQFYNFASLGIKRMNLLLFNELVGIDSLGKEYLIPNAKVTVTENISRSVPPTLEETKTAVSLASSLLSIINLNSKGKLKYY